MASVTLGAGTAVTAAVLALAACSPSPPHPARTPRATATARHDAKAAGTASHGSNHQAAGSNGQAAGGNGQAGGSNGQAAGSGPGQLGSTLAVSDSNGTQLDVTLTKVIDPAQGANAYSNPASGKHFVGVKLRVQNKATTTYQNNANNETTIVLSDGKKLHANYNPIASCGNFDNGQVKLKSGAASTGCVTFQVPKNQKVIQVSYGNTVFPGTTAEWRLS